MRVLNLNETNNVSGGGNIRMTQVISTDGVSDACIAKIVPTIQAAVATAMPKEEMFKIILSACTEAELDILDDRMDETLPIEIEII